MQALDTVNRKTMKSLDTLTVQASIPTDIYSELERFAIDNNFVTTVTGSPKVAHCVQDIVKIFTMAETDDELRLVIQLFFEAKKRKGIRIASTIMEMIDIVLQMHRAPDMKAIREIMGVTTLECLEFIFLIILTTYRKKGMRGDNIEDISAEDIFKESLSEFRLAIREYMVSRDNLSIEDKITVRDTM